MSKHIHIGQQNDCLSLEQFYSYLNDNISDSERKIIENHLIDCVLCSNALEGFSTISQKDAQNSINKIQFTANKITQKKKTPYRFLYFAVAASFLFMLVYVGVNKLSILSEKSQLAVQNKIQIQENEPTNFDNKKETTELENVVEIDDVEPKTEITSNNSKKEIIQTEKSEQKEISLKNNDESTNDVALSVNNISEEDYSSGSRPISKTMLASETSNNEIETKTFELDISNMIAYAKQVAAVENIESEANKKERSVSTATKQQPAMYEPSIQTVDTFQKIDKLVEEKLFDDALNLIESDFYNDFDKKWLKAYVLHKKGEIHQAVLLLYELLNTPNVYSIEAGRMLNK